MKKQKATTRIAALFLQECYPHGVPANADTQVLDREFRACFDHRVHDPVFDPLDQWLQFSGRTVESFPQNQTHRDGLRIIIGLGVR